MTLNLDDQAIFEIEIAVKGYPITWGKIRRPYWNQSRQIVHSAQKARRFPVAALWREQNDWCIQLLCKVKAALKGIKSFAMKFTGEASSLAALMEEVA